MIYISKTPLRMSFVGGGSDIPGFYRKKRGAVISTSIDKYIYVVGKTRDDDKLRISYSQTETVGQASELNHSIFREALKEFGISSNLEFGTFADIPAYGTGLGSSSSFTVGLVHLLNKLLQKTHSAGTLAETACKIEIERCFEPIGKQDQYAAAYGGFNLIEFDTDDSVNVVPLQLSPQILEILYENILCFNTRKTRSASEILHKQSKALEEQNKLEVQSKMVDLVYDLYRDLSRGFLNNFGEILHENWMLKKSLATVISDYEIDEYYSDALKSGALGGKLLGAGAGGYLLIYAPRKNHKAILEKLKHLDAVKFGFSKNGSTILGFD